MKSVRHNTLKPLFKAKRRYTSRHSRRRKRRVCCLWLLIALLVIASILLVVRWDAWFGNTPEAPYNTPQTIDRICLTPGVDFVSQRVVSWRCDTMLQASWLEYKQIGVSLAADSLTITLPTRYHRVSTRGGLAYYYYGQINGLKPGATYAYRAITGDKVSDWYQFVMPLNDRKQQFLYIGDVQDPVGTVSDSLFSILRERYPRPDFIAFGGDQIERPIDQYWHLWYNSLGAWPTSVPMICATGNHEYIKGFDKRLDERWVPQFNYPPNGPKGYISRSYFVDFPLLRFVVIDSNDLLWPWDVQRVRSWLEKTLRSTSQPWRIVMFHHPIYSVRDGRLNPVMRYGFRSILESQQVDLVLQGHDHAYSRTATKKEDGARTTPIYVVSCASPKLYRNGFADTHDRIGAGLYLYQTIELTTDSLRYRAYEFDAKTYDDLILIRSLGTEHKELVDKAYTWPEKMEFDSFGTGKKAQKKRDRYRQEAQERLLRRKALI